MRRITTIILLMSMLTVLCSCSDSFASAADAELVGATLNGTGGGRLFTPSMLMLPEREVTIIDAVLAGNDVVMCGLTSDREYVFFRMGVSEQIIDKIDGLELNNLISMDGLPDGRALITSMNANGKYTMYMLFPDSFGNTDKEFSELPYEFPQELAEMVIYDVKADEASFLVVAENSVYQLSFPMPEILKKFGPYDHPPQLVRNTDGNYYIISSPDSNDASTRFECICALEHDGKHIFSVTGEYINTSKFSIFFDNFLDSSIPAYGDAILSCIRPNTNQVESYANLFNSGSAPNAFVYISHDIFFGILQSGVPAIWSVNTSNERQTIKLATCTGFDPTNDMLLKNAASEFNASNPDYMVDFIDYSSYASAKNVYGGIDQLNLDIISGQTPDIYDLWSLSSTNYSAKGLLEDLLPFFASDSDINFDDLLPVASILMSGGHLYDLVPSFSVTTVYGSSKLVEGHFSVDDLIKYAQKYGAEKVFGAGITREMFLSRIITYTGTRFVDYNTASCDFTCSEFLQFLQFSSQLPVESDHNSGDWERIYYGEQLFCLKAANNPVAQYLYMDTLYNGTAVSVGFPGSGNNGVAMTPLLRLGISSTSENKDGAWAFFKYLLSEYYQQKTDGIPMTEKAYTSAMARWIENAKAETKMGLYRIVDGVPEQADILMKTPSGRTKECVEKIVNSIDCINVYDPYLYDIILSEANLYYSGQYSVEDASKNIQSRASIYLSEQYG